MTLLTRLKNALKGWWKQLKKALGFRPSIAETFRHAGREIIDTVKEGGKKIADTSKHTLNKLGGTLEVTVEELADTLSEESPRLFDSYSPRDEIRTLFLSLSKAAHDATKQEREHKAPPKPRYR